MGFLNSGSVADVHSDSGGNVIMLYILGVVITAMWTESKACVVCKPFISVLLSHFLLLASLYLLRLTSGNTWLLLTLCLCCILISTLDYTRG